MAKIDPLDDVGSLANTTSARAVINNNSQKIEDAFANTLSRDGSAPNQMEADFDLNNHYLLNVADPVNDADGVNLRSVRPLVEQFASEIVETAVFGTQVVDTFPAASVGQTIFTLSNPPGSIENVEFFVNGSAKRPGTDFTLSGAELKTLTLVSPLAGSELAFARYSKALPSDTSLAANVNYTPPSTGVAGTVKSFLDSLWNNTGAALIRFVQNGTGATQRTVQDKLLELPVSIMDYIPVAEHAAIKARTSTYDCTADFQDALNDLQSRQDGGRLFLPNGSYKITGQLNYTGKSITIEGETEEGVRIVTSAGAHTFNLQLTGPIGSTPAQETYDACVIRNLTMFPAANSTGAAINVEYTQDNGVFCFTLIENVRLQNDLTNPWSFKYGIRTANAGGVTLRRVTIYFLGPASDSCYFIDNNLANGAFGIKLENVDFNGALYGIKQRGWMESLYIGPGSAIVGSTDCIDLDATGTPFGSPHLYVAGVHFNAKRHIVRTVNWRTIYLSGCDMYAGVGTDDVNGDGLQVTNGQWVHVTGCKFEQGVLSTTRGGISLNDVQGYAISGNTFTNITGTVITSFGTSSDRGAISGNVIWRDTGTAGVTGIFLAGPNYCTITGNMIRNYAKAIEVSGQAATITGNIFRTATQGIIGTAQTIAYNNLFAAVTTPFTTVGQREFYATVTVDPPSVPAGGGATSVVAVPGAVVGDFVDVAAPYDMTDVMVTAQVIAAGSVGLYYWNRTGAPVDKASGSWKFRIHN